MEISIAVIDVDFCKSVRAVDISTASVLEETSSVVSVQQEVASVSVVREVAENSNEGEESGISKIQEMVVATVVEQELNANTVDERLQLQRRLRKN